MSATATPTPEPLWTCSKCRRRLPEDAYAAPWETVCKECHAGVVKRKRRDWKSPERDGIYFGGEKK